MGRAASTGEGATCPFIARRHAARRTLYLEGDAAERLWFVRDGAVLLSRGAADGEAVQAVRWPGALIGLEALGARRYRDTARVAGDATLCGASRDAVLAWLGHDTPALALLRHVALQLADDPTRPSGPARGRVARWLLEEADATRELARQTIARLLDLAPETLSRVLAELAAAGVIRLTRRSLAVLRPDALARIAGVDGP